MIYGTLAKLGGGGSLATRMWSQAADRSVQLPVELPSTPIGLPRMPIDLPPAPIDNGPVRLPAPQLPGDGVSVIL